MGFFLDKFSGGDTFEGSLLRIENEGAGPSSDVGMKEAKGVAKLEMDARGWSVG